MVPTKHPDRLESHFNESEVRAEQKVVRDSFSMIQQDYALIDAIIERCLKKGVKANKSQVLRAGLHALDRTTDKDLVQVFGNLVAVRAGRRRQNKPLT